MGVMALLPIAAVFGMILYFCFNTPAKRAKREKEARNAQRRKELAEMQRKAKMQAEEEQRAFEADMMPLVSQFARSPFTDTILAEMHRFAGMRQFTCISSNPYKIYVEVADGIRENLLKKDAIQIEYRQLGYTNLRGNVVYAFSRALQQKLGGDYELRYDSYDNESHIRYKRMEDLAPKLKPTH